MVLPLNNIMIAVCPIMLQGSHIIDVLDLVMLHSNKDAS